MYNEFIICANNIETCALGCPISHFGNETTTRACTKIWRHGVRHQNWVC